MKSSDRCKKKENPMSTQGNSKPAPPTISATTASSSSSLDELIAEQGVGKTATFERLVGSCTTLWSDEKEFEAFLEHLKAIRNEKTGYS